MCRRHGSEKNKMGKVTESTVGCRLKTGTLIYLWITVVLSTSSIIIFLLLHLEDLSRTRHSNTSYLFCYIMMDLWVAITGIFAVERKKPSLLLPFLTCKVFDLGVLVVMLLFYFKPTFNVVILELRNCLSRIFGSNDSTIILEESSMIFAICFFVVLGLKIYFALVVYRYYHTMKEDHVLRSRIIVHLRPTPVCYITLK